MSQEPSIRSGAFLFPRHHNIRSIFIARGMEMKSPQGCGAARGLEVNSPTPAFAWKQSKLNTNTE